MQGILTRGLPARHRAAGAILLLALLSGCALGPPHARPGAARPSTDGPAANPPAGLANAPDATPKLEPIRVGGPNKPYVVLGRSYVPMTQDRAFAERGLASWYGRKFQGLPTSSGEPYDMYAMTAAHPTLPIPSYVRVRNPANGREVLVRVNDRGPFHPGRVIDLSYTAALKLDLLRGVAPVEVERITYDEIRTGAWRRDGDAQALRLAAGDAPSPPRAAAVAASVGSVPVVAPPIADTPAAAAPGSSDATDPTRAAAAFAGAAPAAAAAGVTPGVAAAPPAENGVGGVASVPSVPVAAVATVAVAGAAAGAVDSPRALAPDVRAGAEPGFWVQLGAFRERSGAATFQRRVARELEWLTPLLSVFDDAALYRLQAGPYASRDSAQDAAESIRGALKLVPVIVERR